MTSKQKAAELATAKVNLKSARGNLELLPDQIAAAEAQAAARIEALKATEQRLKEQIKATEDAIQKLENAETTE